jgi:hypothetical protein
MHELKEKRCPACGPPFDAIHDLTGMEVCSFACGKRYVQEALAKPYGLKIKHGKSIEITDLSGEVVGIIPFLDCLTMYRIPNARSSL